MYDDKPARNLSRTAGVSLSHTKTLIKHGFILFYLADSVTTHCTFVQAFEEWQCCLILLGNFGYFDLKRKQTQLINRNVECCQIQHFYNSYSTFLSRVFNVFYYVYLMYFYHLSIKCFLSTVYLMFIITFIHFIQCILLPLFNVFLSYLFQWFLSHISSVFFILFISMIFITYIFSVFYHLYSTHCLRRHVSQL